MYMRDYQHAAYTFAAYPKDEVGVLYPFIALAEEAGEVAGKVAKAIRKGQPPLGFEQVQGLKKELGDVLWQLAACCVELNINLDEVAVDNLAKLRDRLARDVIIGEGDSR